MFYKIQCFLQSGESFIYLSLSVHIKARRSFPGTKPLTSVVRCALQGHGTGALQVLHHQ